MPKHSHRYVRTLIDEETREPHGFMSLKEVARHFAVSETTVRLSRGEFACLRRQYVGGNPETRKGSRVLIVREDVVNLSKKLEREAMCVDEKCSTQKETERARNEAYRKRREEDSR